MAETRKIAAILAADVVGFSRLAGADEDRTLARLRALRSELIDPTIAVHNGRVVQAHWRWRACRIPQRRRRRAMRHRSAERHGRAQRRRARPTAVSTFGSAFIWRRGRGERRRSDGRRRQYRRAAEGIAAPGAICLSEDAYRQVSGRLDMEVTDLGQTQLKNIEKSIRAYSLRVGVPAQAKPATPVEPATPKKRPVPVLLGAGIVTFVVITAGIWLAMRPANGPEVSATTPRLSIVVLPFANLSGDPAQDYLADVLTEGLTTGLSRISGTFVIARSTAFTYKGKPADVKQIGRDLGVRYVLEGANSTAAIRCG